MKKKIAWFTPTSNINDFSLAEYSSKCLLPILSKHFEITVFSDSFENKYLNIPNQHFLTAQSEHENKDFDIFFYNFEDKPYCNFIRIHLALIPGVIWFHNFTFTTHGPEPILNSNWENIVNKFHNYEIPWSSRSKIHKPKGKLGFREGAFALKAFFSNQANVYQYKECKIKLAETPCSYLAIPITDTPIISDEKNDIFTIAISGNADIENRSHKIVKALSEVDFKFKLIWHAEANQINKIKLLTKKLTNVEIDTNFSISSWNKIVQKSDCAIHLLYSAYNQNSLFLLQSLCLGKPTLVTTFGANDLISDKIVFKIEPGMYEATQIKMTLEALYKENVDFDRNFIIHEGKAICDINLISSELINFLDNFSETSKKFLIKWSHYKAYAKSDLKNEIYEYHKGETFSLETRILDKYLPELHK